MSSTSPFSEQLRLLHLEDSVADADLIRVQVSNEWPDCHIVRVENREEFVAALDGGEFNLILSDYSLPQFNGLEALDIVRQRGLHTPVVFLSGTIGEDNAVEALRRGAVDYIIKDRPARLISAVRGALVQQREHKLRRKAEQLVRDQADLLHEARDAIVVADGNNHVTFWNKGAERVFGWISADTMGKPLGEIFGIVPSQFADLQSSLQKTGGWEGELAATRRNGEKITVETHSTLIRGDAGVPRVQFHIVTDVTEKKLLQEQLLRVQRLESIGMLAAGIAHDLNNVLTPILMAAPMLRQHATETADLHMLETLEHSAERGAALVCQILAFTRGTTGEPKLMQIKHLVREVIEVIVETFPKSIVLEREIHDGLWPIRGNPTQIHQVLLNLCVNARDAMPKGGTLSLRAKNALVDESLSASFPGARTGEFVLFEVADTGTGIAAGILEHIWEPFYTTKGEGNGTGLGLSTVRGIVNDHGGFIRLQTELGSGTTFSVYLPAAETETTGKGDSSQPFIPRGNGELILFLDEANADRDVAQATLARQGYRVMVASNGVEAMGLFIPRINKIKLLLTDLNLPRLGGAALARTLQRLKPSLKVVAVGAPLAAQESKKAASQSLSVAAVVPRPLKTESLLTAVHLGINSTA